MEKKTKEENMSDGSFEEYTDSFREPLKMWTFSINLLSTPPLSWKRKKNLQCKLGGTLDLSLGIACLFLQNQTGFRSVQKSLYRSPQFTIREKKFAFKIFRLSKLNPGCDKDIRLVLLGDPFTEQSKSTNNGKFPSLRFIV